MNISWTPATAGVVLLSIINRCLHLRRDTWWAGAGTADNAERTFSSLLGMSLRWCSFVSSSHPRTYFFVDQAASPCSSFFVDIGSFQMQSVATLGQKTVSIPRKRWRSICVRSWDLPWHVEIKSSRQTSAWAKACSKRSQQRRKVKVIQTYSIVFLLSCQYNSSNVCTKQMFPSSCSEFFYPLILR